MFSLPLFFYLLTFLSLICDVTESNLAAASTFHFIDCCWLHKAVIKPPHLPHGASEPCWERAGRSGRCWFGSPVYSCFSVICVFSAGQTLKRTKDRRVQVNDKQRAT